MKRSRLHLLFVAAALEACAPSPGPDASSPDAGDAASDAPLEVSPDASLFDGALEGSVDATASEASPDTALAEAALDALAEAALDATVDAVVPDAPPDILSESAVDVASEPPFVGCSDGVVQFGEQCDDGNRNPGDGCSASCTLEGAYGTEMEPNNTQATANNVGGARGMVGSLDPAGDADWFTVMVSVPGSSVFADVTDGFARCPSGFDSVLELYSPAGVLLATDDNGGVAPCSRLDPTLVPGATNLAAGLYALRVRAASAAARQPAYLLGVRVVPPSCGDGVRQAGEQCDDGGTIAGDGCSATCQFEGNFVAEVEPNNTLASANLLPPGAEGFVASLQPLGDVDYFRVQLSTPGMVTATVTDGLRGCPAGIATSVTLLSPSGAVLTMDSSRPCASVTQPGLSPGTYTVRVQHPTGAATVPQYVLLLRASP